MLEQYDGDPTAILVQKGAEMHSPAKQKQEQPKQPPKEEPLQADEFICEVYTFKNKFFEDRLITANCDMC